MDLLADLRHYPAADALQWLGAAHFDGRLVFQRNRRTVGVAVAGGRIVSCVSNNPLETFRRHLYSQAWVDRLDLAAASRQAEEQGLAETLVASNVLSRRQLREACTEHTLDLICSVATWPDGVVAASASRLRQLNEPESQPLDPVFAIMEATRRIDHLARIRETVPHDNVRLGVGHGSRGDKTYSPPQERLLQDFDGSYTVGQLHQVVGGCEYSFLRDLAELLDGGALVCTEVGAAPAPPEENRVSLADVLFDHDLDLHLQGPGPTLGLSA